MICSNCEMPGADHLSRLCSRCRWESRSVIIAFVVVSLFVTVMVITNCGAFR